MRSNLEINSKLSTGIEGLDEMFYGGIFQERSTNNHKGVLILARGEHGVNKIHLAMQMCEGMYKDENEKDGGKYAPISFCDNNTNPNTKILFISLNKSSDLLKNLYFDFYIQRLIRGIREDNDKDNVQVLRQMLWYADDTCKGNEFVYSKSGKGSRLLDLYKFPSITHKETTTDTDDLFKQHIQDGFIYYSELTHGLHIRCQRGEPDQLLCKWKLPDNSIVKIVGKDQLNEGNLKTDGLTLFLKMLEETRKKEYSDVDYIMVDGLSRLSKDELVQCPFNALSDTLRMKAKRAAIITADEKLLPSDISVDIVIDMAIKQRERTDQQYNALRISKCLYQKNAYGWHNYKMRISGIEVIPSLHLQLKTRFLMDDAVVDAKLPFNKCQYSAWVNNLSESCTIDQVSEKYNDYKENNWKKDNCAPSDGCLVMIDIDDSEVKRKIIQGFKGDAFLFVGLRQNRRDCIKDIYTNYDPDESILNRIHLFCFEPGYIHTDDFLWTIDRQVRALNGYNNSVNKNIYNKVHLIIGDLHYINYAYPCLEYETLLLPALYQYTKKHHMVNYINYTIKPDRASEKDKILYRKILSIVDYPVSEAKTNGG